MLCRTGAGHPARPPKPRENQCRCMTFAPALPAGTSPNCGASDHNRPWERDESANLSRRKSHRVCLSERRSALILAPARALAQGLRGALEAGIDATHEGLNPGSPDDQSEAFAQSACKGRRGRPPALPAARTLRDRAMSRFRTTAHIIGIPGQSHCVFRGGSALFRRAARRLGAA